jgi:protein pelota
MPEESEDIWHAYNLISEGDCVRAPTIRFGRPEFIM